MLRPVISFSGDHFSSGHSMAESRCFSLLGDSNVRKYINKNACRANVSLKSAQVLLCGHLGIFTEMLTKIRPESNACILSCISNFLTKPEGATVAQRVEPVLQDVREALLAVCTANPDRFYLVSPPMYRTSPIWYREGLPEVLSLFSQVLSQDRPPNLLLLPSFPTPEYDHDGVHLTAYSGLEFVLHLFDSANLALDNLDLDCESTVVRSCESTRVLEDRVMVLEQDHRRLTRVVDKKTASDAELADFHQNERMENCFMIYGLTAISSEIIGKEWQTKAVQDVQAALVSLMGKEYEIIVVQNATKRHKDAEVAYCVKMVNVADSKAIRRKFGSFFFGGVDKRPPELKKINIKNWVTPNTRIRVDVLKLIAQRYRDSNRGSRVTVIHHEPRPLIKIIPSSAAQDRRTMSFYYVEAVLKLKVNFSEAEITPILRRVNPDFYGQIRTIFIVLSDDMFKKVTSKFNKQPRGSNRVPLGASAQAEVQESASDESDEEEVAPDGVVAAAVAVPVPPPPPVSLSNKQSRSSKRGAASQGGPSAKK